jgi:type II secretory ATPase GspE/PulE/Tfp pilus assembly ATPase PilB-like protein
VTPTTAETLALWAADGDLPVSVAADTIRTARRDRRDPLLHLLDSGRFDRAAALRLIAAGLDMPLVDLTDPHVRTDTDAVERVGIETLRDACAIPIIHQAPGEPTGSRALAAAQPRDAATISTAAAAYTGVQAPPVSYADPVAILHRLDTAARTLATLTTPTVELEQTAAVQRIGAERHMPLWLTEVLDSAHRLSASDVHLAVEGDRAIYRLRVDRAVTDPTPIDAPADKAIRAALQHLGMDAAVTGRGQDASQDHTMSDGTRVRLRATASPTHHGTPHITVRLFDTAAEPPALDRLGMSAQTTTLLRRLTAKPSPGLIVVSGQSSGGKTTTQYAMLRQLTARNHIIFAIEDTLEYILQSATHVPVTDDYPWDAAIRQAMRANVDVLLVGETRDEPTAHAVVNAAKTGAMTMTTLHARSAINVFPRLIGLDISANDAAAVVRLVIHQELLPRLHDCALAVPISAADTRRLLEMGVPVPESGIVSQAGGCDGCRGSGYAGLVPLVELLLPDAAMRDAITSDGGYAALERAAEPGVNWVPASIDAGRLLNDGLVAIDDLTDANLIESIPLPLPDGDHDELDGGTPLQLASHGDW